MLSKAKSLEFDSWVRKNYPELEHKTRNMSLIGFCEFIGFEYRSYLDINKGKFLNDFLFDLLVEYINENYEGYIKFRLL